MAVPQPRAPLCTKHHVWHASCPDCCSQHEAERAAARARLEWARRHAGTP